MLLMFKELSVPISKAGSMSEAELEGRIVIGEFANKERVGLAKAYKQLLEGVET